VADSNLSLFNRRLNTEERQWLRDLLDHPGYRLAVEAIQERMAQDLQTLVSSGDTQRLFQAQGRWQARQEDLATPSQLLAVVPAIQPPR
jgi:hypothetical protein